MIHMFKYKYVYIYICTYSNPKINVCFTLKIESKGILLFVRRARPPTFAMGHHLVHNHRSCWSNLYARDGKYRLIHTQLRVHSSIVKRCA